MCDPHMQSSFVKGSYSQILYLSPEVRPGLKLTRVVFTRHFSSKPLLPFIIYFMLTNSSSFSATLLCSIEWLTPITINTMKMAPYSYKYWEIVHNFYCIGQRSSHNINKVSWINSVNFIARCRHIVVPNSPLCALAKAAARSCIIEAQKVTKKWNTENPWTRRHSSELVKLHQVVYHEEKQHGEENIFYSSQTP